MMAWSKRNTSKRGGFTLIELIISVFIVALVSAITLPMVNSALDVHLKASAQKMGGNIKYLFDRAVLERIYIRLVIDLDNNVYWSESTKDPFFLRQKPQEVKDGVLVEEEEEEEEDELGNDQLFQDSVLFQDPSEMKWQGWQDFADKFKKKKAEFSQYNTELSSRTEVPKEVHILKVETESVAEPVTSGQVFIHFFPNGYVEKCGIWMVPISDWEDEELLPDEMETYSLIVKSLTGRATIYNYKVDLPEDEMDEEAW